MFYGWGKLPDSHTATELHDNRNVFTFKLLLQVPQLYDPSCCGDLAMDIFLFFLVSLDCAELFVCSLCKFIHVLGAEKKK